MQFLTSLLGGSSTTIMTAVLALGFVLVLIVLAVWVLKATLKPAMVTPVRGRSRRLAIVEQVQIDAKRQVVIVRRDNVEHVLLTGGPEDVVIESGIPVEPKPALAPAPLRRPAAVSPAEAKPAAESVPTDPPPDASPFERRPEAPAPLGQAQIARLRAFIRPEGVRKSPALRHTGLLRPVSTMEPAVIPMAPIAGDKSGGPPGDSATKPASIDSNGRGKLGAARYIGNGQRADNA